MNEDQNKSIKELKKPSFSESKTENLLKAFSTKFHNYNDMLHCAYILEQPENIDWKTEFFNENPTLVNEYNYLLKNKHTYTSDAWYNKINRLANDLSEDANNEFNEALARVNDEK